MTDQPKGDRQCRTAAKRELLRFFADMDASDARTRNSIVAIAFVIALAAAYFAAPAVPDSLILVCFLAAVTIAAAISNMPTAIASATASTAAFTLLAGRSSEYPYVVYALTGGITLGGIAVALGIVANRLRARSALADQRAADMAGLYHFSRQLVGATSLDDVADLIIETGERLLGCRTILLVQGDQPHPASLKVYPTDLTLSRRDREAALSLLGDGARRDRRQDDFPDVQYMFMPLIAGDNTFGVVGFIPDDDEEDDRETFKERLAAYRLTGSFIDLASLAVAERFFTRALDDTADEAELHSRRSDLLISLAHDLNSPLSAIVGASSSLLQYDAQFDRITRQDMVATIHEEAQRLTRYIRNLLQLTKFENEDMVPRLVWIEVADLIGSAVIRMKKFVKDRSTEMKLADNLPLMQADFILLEQAIANLLENAAKYSEADNPIWIEADHDDQYLRIRVRDSGLGLSADDTERIFDRMYRARKRDHATTGSGLGLTVARAIVEAHGGTLRAESPGLGHGSTFTISLPVPTQPAGPAENEGRI